MNDYQRCPVCRTEFRKAVGHHEAAPEISEGRGEQQPTNVYAQPGDPVEIANARQIIADQNIYALAARLKDLAVQLETTHELESLVDEYDAKRSAAPEITKPTQPAEPSEWHDDRVTGFHLAFMRAGAEGEWSAEQILAGLRAAYAIDHPQREA